MLKDLVGRPRNMARKRFGLLRALSGAALSLCVVSASASAQDTAQSEVRDLDALLNTPVSTAAKYAQGVRQVAGAVTIVTAEDIRRFGYRTLAEVLQSMAGIYTTNPRSYESIGVRGFGRPTDYNNRILVLMDGHSVFESMWGQAMLGDEQALNLQSVERIELVRGPSSSLYGTGAMFAVVNVITRRGSDVGGAEVTVEGGNLGRRGASLVAGTQLGPTGSILVSGLMEEAVGQRKLYFPEFDDPATNNGIAENLDGSRRASAGLNATLGSFALRSSYNHRDRHDPTGSYATVFNADYNLVDYSWFTELSHVAEISPVHRLSSRAYYDDQRYRGDYPYVGYTWRERSVNRVAGLETSLRWDLAASNRLTLGAEYRRNLETHYYSPDDATFDYGRPFSVISLYLQDEHQLLPNLTLLGGVRHDDHEINGGATTPRAAILFDPRPGTTLKLMYGHAFRTPTIYESEFKAPTVSDALKPERLRMLEFIWLQRLNEQMMVTGSVFHYRVEDLIDAVEDSAEEQQLAYVNRDLAKASGVELTLDARPTRASRGYLNYTFQRAVGSDGSALTNSPRHMLKGGFALDLAAQVSPALELRYESSRLTTQDTRTDGFLVTNLNLSFRPLAKLARKGTMSGMELGLQVKNLLDTRYYHPGGVEHVMPAIEQDGRTLVLRLSTRF